MSDILFKVHKHVSALYFVLHIRACFIQYYRNRITLPYSMYLAARC
jgi:hypothetical protein